MTALFWVQFRENVRGPYVSMPTHLIPGERVLMLEVVDVTGQYSPSAFEGAGG